MTLDATKPDGATFLSDYSTYMRETRAAVNDLISTAFDGSAGVTTLNSDADTLNVGTELGAYAIETVLFSGGANLATITGGTSGQTKVFVCQSATLTFVHDGVTEVGGVLRLNDFGDFTAAIGDKITFINIGGDGALQYGYWQEVDRTLKVT